MKNVLNDFQLIKEAEATVLRELSIEVATKEGAKSTNRNSKLGVAISYIVSETLINGQLKDIRREDIEQAASVSKTDANGAVKKLVDKGLVAKYKKVNQVVDKRGRLTSKFRFDKYVYTLVATEKLFDMVSEDGTYEIPFSKESLRDLHTQAASESEKVTVVRKTVKGVNVDEITTTNARGERVKETKVDIDSAEQREKELEEELAEVRALKEQDGKVEELSTVQPLVSQENILAMDIEEFKAEQQDEEEELEWLELEDDEEEEVVVEPEPVVAPKPVVKEEIELDFDFDEDEFDLDELFDEEPETDYSAGLEDPATESEEEELYDVIEEPEEDELKELEIELEDDEEEIELDFDLDLPVVKVQPKPRNIISKGFKSRNTFVDIEDDFEFTGFTGSNFKGIKRH